MEVWNPIKGVIRIMLLEVEQSLRLALAQREFDRARELWDQLPSDSNRKCRRCFWGMLIRSRLSSFQYPTIFVEYMELVHDKTVEHETRVLGCAEAAWVALRLNDPGRMAQVETAFRMLTRHHGKSAAVLRWRGPIMLSLANGARQAGDATALGLYQRAVAYLREHEDFWYELVAGLSRMAVLLDQVGQPVAAAASLLEAGAVCRGERNIQEIYLARGVIALNQMRWADAIAAGTQAAAYADDQADYYVLVETYGLLAMAHAASGQYEPAAEYGTRAGELAVRERLYHLIDSPEVEAWRQIDQ